MRLPITSLSAIMGALIICAAGTAPDPLLAQAIPPDDLTIHFGALVQPRLSVERGGIEHDGLTSGFGVQRLWLHTDIRIGERVDAFARVDGSTGTARFLDASLGYRASERITLRAGRFLGAQPRGAALTPGGAIDLVERPAVAELWAQGTRGGDGRSYGVEGILSAPRTGVRLFLHNGSNAVNVRSSVRDQAGRATAGATPLAIAGFMTHRPAGIPGLELGGHAGYDSSRNDHTVIGETGRRYGEVSGHLYWGAEPGSQGVRLKADAIAVRYEAASPGAENGRILSGLSLLGAVAVGTSAEIAGRVETVSDPGVEPTDLILTVGGSHSPSVLRGLPYGRERITASYGVRIPGDGTDAMTRHLLIVQAQIAF